MSTLVWEDCLAKMRKLRLRLIHVVSLYLYIVQNYGAFRVGIPYRTDALGGSPPNK